MTPYLATRAAAKWIAAILLSAALAPAHELEATVSLAAPAVVVRATYGGTEPVPHAKVRVFGPSTPEQEFQTGVTDRRGYFSFVPDVPGLWRIVIDDESGHMGEAKASVPDPFTRDAPAPAAPGSRAERVALALAVIAGLTGVLYGYRVRRGSSRTTP